MKNVSSFINALLLSSSLAMLGSQAPIDSTHELSTTENDCFKWFVDTAKKLPSTLQTLSQEDQQVWNNGIKYTENPDAVTQSRHHYVLAFIAQAQQAHIPLKYNEATIQAAVLKSVIAMHTKSVKVTDELSLRMSVYAQLSAEEQATWQRDNYLKYPDQALIVAKKWSELVADQCVKYGFINAADKEKKAAEVYNEKNNKLQKMHTTLK